LKRLVLDTNLLILWIVGNLGPARIGGRRLEAFEIAHLEWLNQFTGQFQGYVSTPNILTEASNLIGSGNQQLCKGACDALAEYISVLDEVYVPSASMLAEPYFAKLGLADASLVALSRRGDHVLTADGPLYGLFTGYGVRIHNFLHEVQITR